MAKEKIVVMLDTDKLILRLKERYLVKEGYAFESYSHAEDLERAIFGADKASIGVFSLAEHRGDGNDIISLAEKLRSDYPKTPLLLRLSLRREQIPSKIDGLGIDLERDYGSLETFQNYVHSKLKK